MYCEYVLGDDICYIDWKVWFKIDWFYIKEYEEEINFKCMILFDFSKFMCYGEYVGWSKFDYGLIVVVSFIYLL